MTPHGGHAKQQTLTVGSEKNRLRQSAKDRKGTDRMVKRNWQKLYDADSELGELKSAEENMWGN